MSIASKCTCGKAPFCVGGEGCLNIIPQTHFSTPTVMYVVVAYRWGNTEKHSYIVGVFTLDKDAISAAELETTYRGGKYSCQVEKCRTDMYDNENQYDTEVIYKTTIPYNH